MLGAKRQMRSRARVLVVRRQRQLQVQRLALSTQVRPDSGNGNGNGNVGSVGNGQVNLRRGAPHVTPSGPVGMYDPAMDRDSCGVGMIASLKGEVSHRIVADANEMLARMAHRGGCGCEKNTGDGAGILVGMPDSYMRKVAGGIGLALPAAGQYASGIVFTSLDEAAAGRSKAMLEANALKHGVKVMGWRKVPTDNSMLGSIALESQPNMEQVFVENSTGHELEVFERELMRMRKATEGESHAAGLHDFYVCSLSARTVTYKGQLTPEQLPQFYLDLQDGDFASHLALVHSRFSTNTFPSWDRAQPNRMLCHNGEINTLRGNKNMMYSRSGVMRSPLLPGSGAAEQPGLLPICSNEMTDSGNADAVLELLVKASDRSIAETMMMMIPEAWQQDVHISAAKKDFYQYNSCIMEPWDGPAMMAFTDGRYVGACLDRNGLRPSRYYVTEDQHVMLSSEVGVLPNLDPATVTVKGRLEPGKLFLVDFETQRIVHDEELKTAIAEQRPYGAWVRENLARLPDWAGAAGAPHKDADEATAAAGRGNTAGVSVRTQLQAFGYTVETLDLLLAPMATGGKEALGSMGVDAPLAVLSRFPKGPAEYFKQLFAQVTNPPIDPIREEIVMSLECPVGPEQNLLEVTAAHARRLLVEEPVLSSAQMARIKATDASAEPFMGTWFSKTLDMTYDADAPDGEGEGLQAALARLCAEATEAVEAGGTPVLVLSHDALAEGRVAVPSLLALGAVHQHLVQTKQRTATALFLDGGDVREVHDFATAFGFGADAVCPSVAYAALRELNASGRLAALAGKSGKVTDAEAEANYRTAATKGLLKVMSKMGISTLQSYKGAQIFEAVGLDPAVVATCFTGTTSRIKGAGFRELAADARANHAVAFPATLRQRGGSAGARAHEPMLQNDGTYHFRDGGEAHLNDPAAMAALQTAVRDVDPKAWADYTAHTKAANRRASLRGLMTFDVDPATTVSVDEVEPASEILRRFVTGAMSLGSISSEAHETLAVAMNELGGRSNTGEGGEKRFRYHWEGPRGESKRSAIKQVASGRFGVTAEYLANSDQIQIKVSQGAKPGEGGELPGFKVSDEIADTRGTTAGVGLISPPPHHDIYSIEDLAQLIFDLKNSNPEGSVSVKLVSENGVGIVAAGTAKAFADHIVISGGDGGTGAAAWTGIHRAGLPWELGLAEAQHTLVVNKLRDRVVLQADGQMKTGRDVVIAALLGAEEFGFSTAPLIALGCIMMRKCHLNTCPVGIATQDPELRAKFAGQPEHVVNFFRMLAEDVRQYMALLGYRRFDDMVGQAQRLRMDEDRLHSKCKGLDLSNILLPIGLMADHPLRNRIAQEHQLGEVLDRRLIAEARASIEHGGKAYCETPIDNLDRAVGAMLSNRIVRAHGAEGLPDDTVHVKFLGSAGQSFGFALMQGVTFELEGDANDGVGKCLSGGQLVVKPPKHSHPAFEPRNNIIIGNVALYGASSGALFARGVAGERFAVRNSGATAVVEGTGDHACEYMTGGAVAILGPTGRNCAAGMSGGLAFVYDPERRFPSRCNAESVSLEGVRDEEHRVLLRDLVERHRRLTGSDVARELLQDWDKAVQDFVLVYPHDYKRIVEERKAAAAVAEEEQLLASVA